MHNLKTQNFGGENVHDSLAFRLLLAAGPIQYQYSNSKLAVAEFIS